MLECGLGRSGSDVKASAPSQNDCPGDTPLVNLRQVVKKYEDAAGSVTALWNIDLQVNTSEFVAVIGKSGSGKTTLVNMITGIDKPTSGMVKVNGVLVSQLDGSKGAEWRGRNIGIVFQFFQLLPGLTVLQNVTLPMDFAHLYSVREARKRGMFLLEQVGIAEHAHKRPSALSGGQQQRVAIARALANDPPLLVADEPTGNLDLATASLIFHLFEELAAQGKTLLVVTHDKELTRRVPRVVTLADGEIVHA
jgi:putative ABC transport system ATP-binding protein